MGQHWVPKNYLKQVKWLINKAYLEGHSLEAGMILLPGSISPAKILNKGLYQIDYSSLGEQSLLVR